jgi:penicillin-binding protein 2
MLATPLQIANSYSAMANGGYVLSPNVTKMVTAPRNTDDQLGMTLRTVDRRELRDKLAMPSAVTGPILQGLLGVTSKDGGTAFRTFEGFPLDKFPVVGKTGTAQTGSDNKDVNDNSLFVAYAPAYAPKYTVAVVMEKSGFGALAAAPVARLMFEALLGATACVPGDLVPLPEFETGRPVDTPGPLPAACQLTQPNEGIKD